VRSCQLDPAPTWLVKEMRELLSPFILLLFNKSLASGCYPSEFKKAVVQPLLKKHGLDVSQMKNYSPVEAAGENRSESAADLSGQKQPDAEDTVGVPSVPQHRDCRY